MRRRGGPAVSSSARGDAAQRELYGRCRDGDALDPTAARSSDARSLASRTVLAVKGNHPGLCHPVVSRHATAVSDRSPAARSSAVIFYHGGVAGELLEPLNPDIVGDYKFMPYRSESHYRLGLAVNEARLAVVEVRLAGSQVEMVATAMRERSITLEPMEDPA